MSDQASDAVPCPCGWTFRIGFSLPFLGMALYTLQFMVFKSLSLPYYLPVLALVGMVLMVRESRKSKSITRYVAMGLGFVLTLASLFFVFGMNQSEYKGPAKVGAAVPSFSVFDAQGVKIDSAAIAGDKSIVVFFRGRF